MPKQKTYHWPTQERRLIVKALNKYIDSKTMKDIAENVLGISYEQLYSKIRSYKIKKYKVFNYKYK